MRRTLFLTLVLTAICTISVAVQANPKQGNLPGQSDLGQRGTVRLAQGTLFGQPPASSSGETVPQTPQQGIVQPQPVQPIPDQLQQPAEGATGQPQGSFGQQPHDHVAQMESQDFGVPPTSELYNGPPHGPTPTSIPGGRVISTQELDQMMRQEQVLLIDVLSSSMTLPGALPAAGLGGPGWFDDNLQWQAVDWFWQITGGNPQAPIIFFCQGPQCWLSYNAALRAIHAGYRNVIWYRGGIEAWQMRGLPLAAAMR